MERIRSSSKRKRLACFRSSSESTLSRSSRSGRSTLAEMSQRSQYSGRHDRSIPSVCSNTCLGIMGSIDEGYSKGRVADALSSAKAGLARPIAPTIFDVNGTNFEGLRTCWNVQPPSIQAASIPLAHFGPHPWLWSTYGHLIPGANVSFVDRLDGKPAKGKRQTVQPSAIPAQPRVETETEISGYLVDLIGGGGRDRTADLRVMNPSL